MSRPSGAIGPGFPTANGSIVVGVEPAEADESPADRAMIITVAKENTITSRDEQHATTD